MRRWFPLLGWLALLLAFADLVALKSGATDHPPSWLAGLFTVALGLLAMRLVQVLWSLWRRSRRPVGAAGEMLLLGGALLALLGGMANWLLGLQGSVILNEREAVRLHGGTALQAFEAGPLARLDEMGLYLVLDELELAPAGTDGFYPLSRLSVWRYEEEPTPLEATPRQWASAGPLRFHQGAFGFAPRIVLLDGQETLFDRVVPFLTERRGPGGISFQGSFTIEEQGLEVGGAVDLASLDAGMRGHATLEVLVQQQGRLLGRGSLLPGHFAEIEGGYRVGFAGLQRWSEIVISRRNYGQLVLAGGCVALAGGILWPLAAWRRW
jgi:hypothetical protein